jgi:Lipocalin-like domain
LKCLAVRGTLVLIGAASGPPPAIEFATLATRSLSVIRPSVRHFTARPEELSRRAEDVFGWARQDVITTTIAGLPGHHHLHPDGYMSAQLMRSGRRHFSGDDMHPAEDDELAAAASGYLTYAGPYSVVADGLIAHHVEVSLLTNWIGGTQYRAARIQGSVLELGPPEPVLIDGQHRIARLVWRRA